MFLFQKPNVFRLANVLKRNVSRTYIDLYLLSVALTMFGAQKTPLKSQPAYCEKRCRRRRKSDTGDPRVDKRLQTYTHVCAESKQIQLRCVLNRWTASAPEELLPTVVEGRWIAHRVGMHNGKRRNAYTALNLSPRQIRRT